MENPLERKLYANVSMDSYMTPVEDLKVEEVKLLTVDNALLLPMKTMLRFVFTGADVIHS
jgi:heme/copper-type cytochrome/quinol oxidase subunit 2